jgi:plastocyanin
LSVSQGTVVTVTNQDGATHTWTSDTGAFNSGPLGLGGTASFTFATPGSYAYHCAIHSFMAGTINVS